MTPDADLRKALLGVLDDFDRWAGQDPQSHRTYAIDKHGYRWAKFIDLMRAALRPPVEHMPQSTHGCVNCDRPWYDHTPEEKGRWA